MPRCSAKQNRKKKKSWWGGAVGRTRSDPGRGSAGLIFRSSFLDVASLPEVRLPPSHSSDPLPTLGLVGKTARQPLAVSMVGASRLHAQPLPSPSPGTSWGASRGRCLAPIPFPSAASGSQREHLGPCGGSCSCSAGGVAGIRALGPGLLNFLPRARWS